MKSTIWPKENDRSQTRLDSLRALKLDQLAERWRELYRMAMPARLRRSLIIQALAYRLQEKAFGGLKPGTRSTSGDRGGTCQRTPNSKVADEAFGSNGNRVGPRVARHQASGHGAQRWVDVQRKTL
jgi:Protein of unknown function (DUF2924)